MSIEFHCSHCGKLVRAPDDAGGKRGKCPACHQSVYIPIPSDQVEPLGLAPVDDAEEHERSRLLQQSQDLQRRLLHEREARGEISAAPGPSAGDQALPPQPDAETLVIEYAEAMAAGDLARAEELAVDIRKHEQAADDVIQRLMLDELLPERLADIPRPVLIGFLKQLRGKP